MKYHVKQITDRFQNEIVNGGFEGELTVDNGDFIIGEQFWSDNITDDSHSGMYEVVGVFNGDMAC